MGSKFQDLSLTLTLFFKWRVPCLFLSGPHGDLSVSFITGFADV